MLSGVGGEVSIDILSAKVSFTSCPKLELGLLAVEGLSRFWFKAKWLAGGALNGTACGGGARLTAGISMYRWCSSISPSPSELSTSGSAANEVFVALENSCQCNAMSSKGAEQFLTWVRRNF